VLSGRGLCDGLVPCPRGDLPTVVCLTECDGLNRSLGRVRPTRAVEL
jgi:hypothetical protein